ncbi:MAG: ATP-binding protein [Thermocrispum sp.]
MADRGRDRGPAIATTDDIEVRLGAEAVHLPVIRAVAVNLAMRADLDLDSISDLELAVDEACSSLIVIAAESSVLTCRFTVGADDIVFRATVESGQGAPSTGTFGWRVLVTLTDQAESWAEDGRVHIALAKAKPAAAG